MLSQALRHLPLLIALAISSGDVARAARPLPLDEFLESVVGRYLLEENPAFGRAIGKLAGVELEVGVSGASARQDAFRRAQRKLLMPKYEATRSELERSLQSVEERFKNMPKRRATRKSELELTTEEKLILNKEAALAFELNPKWRLGAADGAAERELDFFVPRSRRNFNNTREKFLSESPDPALKDDGAKVPETERVGVRERWTRKLDEMKSCVANRPPSEAAKKNLRFLFRQLLVDEVTTVGGALGASIVSSGSLDDVDWKKLPQDLVFEAMTSIGDSVIASHPGAFRMTWVRVRRMVAWGAIQASVDGAGDAVLYYFEPANPNERDGNRSFAGTGSRLAYNAGWNTLYAPISVALYDLLTGLECIGTRGSIVFGIQTAASLGLSATYFGLRQATPLPGLSKD